MFKKTDILLEACVETLSEAKNAVKFGANRIELCSHLDLDGLTPDKKTKPYPRIEGSLKIQ